MRNADETWQSPDFANDSPVGFVNRFFPKFLPLVQEKYPDENPTQILTRLVKMWNVVHIRQKNFGSTCAETCSCMQGWKLVFREGAVEALGSVRPKRASPGRSLDLAQAIPIPRRRSRNDVSSSSSPSLLTGIASHGNVPRKSVQETAQGSPLLSSFNQQNANDANTAALVDQPYKPQRGSRALEMYSAVYNTSLPLGFYCVTDIIENRVCKIISIYPKGESRKNNSLIQEGTRGKL